MPHTKLLRVPVESLHEGELALDVQASNYVLRVHRARMGDAIELFDPSRGFEAAAVLVRATNKAAVCRVGPVQVASAVPIHDVALLQALAKGEKVDQVIRDATALGVSEIGVALTSRCVPRLATEDSTERGHRWQRIAIQAARQSGRGNIPRIFGPEPLRESLVRVASRPLRLLLSPRASTTLAGVLGRSPPQPVALFVGPEGGLELEEERQLLDAGFDAVRFGKFTLRSETAATAVLGALVDWGDADGLR
jgi:16S rRNA (uracil1498-N3)-methyltransferase